MSHDLDPLTSSEKSRRNAQIFVKRESGNFFWRSIARHHDLSESQVRRVYVSEKNARPEFRREDYTFELHGSWVKLRLVVEHRRRIEEVERARRRR